jgi:hypothetical protein
MVHIVKASEEPDSNGSRRQINEKSRQLRFESNLLASLQAKGRGLFAFGFHHFTAAIHAVG